MTEIRRRRREQLEILQKTVNGRERIVEAYRRTCLPPGEREPIDLPIASMIEEILIAEFDPNKIKHPA